MTPRVRWFVLLFGLIGLAASGASTWVHYQLLENPGARSFCDVNATISCAAVYTSRYGSVAGVPVAVLGALWFALVILLAWAAPRGSSAFQENVPAYLFAMSTLGLSAVIYLAYTSFVILKLVCLMCLATYVAVAGLFLLSGSAGSLPMTKLPRRALGDLRTLATAPVALLLSALFMGTAVAAITMFPRGESRVARAQPAVLAADARTEFLRWYEALPVVALPIAKDGAAVLIVKFNDYQCPPCRASFLEYKRVLDKYRAKPGQIKFVTRDYPLEPECNQYVPREVHPAACEAAVAVRLAAARGGAVKLEEWLFANQQTLTPAVVRQAARDVAGITDFDALYRPTIEQVKADIALGSSLGVRATPTFFINGRKIPDGALPPVYFDTAIAHELQKAGK